MDTLTLLQHYWWLIISLLGALLVFLLFVQGGQAMLYDLGRTDEERNMIVNALGRKWEFTFTTLVTFGGAFFASFPLFYSTSFGGAAYVWTAILLCFVIQAVAYEYRRKPANVFGERTYNAFLLINGLLGPLLLGLAASPLFTGADLTVDRLHPARTGRHGALPHSTYPAPGRGAGPHDPRRAPRPSVTLLAQLLACQYLMNSIDDETIAARCRRRIAVMAPGFVGCFVGWLAALLVADGLTADPATGAIRVEEYKYLHNLTAMPYVAAALLAGVLLVLWSIYTGWRGNRRAVWFGGSGTILAVLALLLAAGWNDTAYYPSLADMQSSLTIRNSSSSLFTLRTMAGVSLFVPFVAAYIWDACRLYTCPSPRDRG